MIEYVLDGESVWTSPENEQAFKEANPTATLATSKEEEETPEEGKTNGDAKGVDATSTTTTPVEGTDLSQTTTTTNTGLESGESLSASQSVKKKSPRTGVRKNEDGTESTHLMRRELVDGKWVVFPSLFQEEDESWKDMSNEEGWGNIYQEAKKRGEVYEFDSEEDATNFADKGSWKEGFFQEDGSLELVNQVTDAYQRFKPTEEDKIAANEEAVSYISDLMDKSSQELPDPIKTERKVHFASKFSTAPSIIGGKDEEYFRVQKEKDDSAGELEEIRDRAIKDLLDQYNSTSDTKIEEDTNEYNEWAESLNEGFVVNAMSNVKTKDITQSIFEDNLKDWAEDKDHWATVKGEEQVELEAQTKEALNVLNTKAKEQVGKSKVVEQNLLTLPDRYDKLKSLNESLETVNNKVSEITSKEYETQEEVDAANNEIEILQKQWNDLNSAYEADGGLSYDELIEYKDNNVEAFKNISRNSEDIITKEEELNTYLDAVGRNYGWVTNVTGQVASAVISAGSAGLELVEKLALDPTAGIINELTGPEAPEWLQPLKYLPGAQKLLLASKTIPEVTDLLDNINEDILNGLEKPSKFRDIKDVEDFGEWFGHLVSSQSVNTAITFGTGGASLYILGGIAAGEKFKEIDKEIAQGKEYTLAQQYVAALGTGAIEGLSEKVTLGQANKVKALLRNNPEAKRGFINVMKNNFGTKRGLYQNIYDPIEEGGSEVIAEFGANVMDKFVLGKEDTSLLEGTDEAFISGVFMSGLVYKSPLIGKNVVRAFQSSDVTSQLADISNKIQEKSMILGEIDLSPENKKKFENDIAMLVDQHTNLMNESIANIDKMSAEERQALINADVTIAALKANNKTISGEFGLSQEQIDTQIEDNNTQIAHLTAFKNQTVANASKGENLSRVERDTEELEKKAKKLFGKPVSVVRVNEDNIDEQLEVYKKAEIEAVDEKIKTKKEQLKVADKESRDKIKEEIETLQKDKAGFEGLTKDTFSSSHGANAVYADLILINPEFAAARGATNVVQHEAMHQLLKNTLADNPKAAVALGNAVDEILSELDPNVVAQSEMASRLTAYASKPQKVRAEEKITLLMDALKSGDIKINTSLGSKLKSPIRRILQAAGRKNIELNTAQDVLNFITDMNAKSNIFGRNKAFTEASLRGINIGKELTAGVVLEDGETASQAKESLDSFYNELSPDDLVQIIKSPSTDAKQLASSNKALLKQFNLLATNALKYDDRKGDINREDVLSAAAVYLPGIINRFDASKGVKFSTFVHRNIAPKQAVIYEEAKSLFFGKDTTSTDSEQARQVADVKETTSEPARKVQPKTNILKFTGISKVLDRITSLVKVPKGRKFKFIISKYAGKVGEIVFDIPAKKIMEGGTNLVPTTKFKDGMAVPSEAQNIQRFFSAPQNLEKFVRTLPLYNVADMDADINELGENIDVSRDTYGVAIGLRGLPLDYFYEDFVDPRATSKDKEIQKKSITSPKGRSRGLTTQTQVKRVKPEFRNATPEVIDKLKEDLGITPERTQPNIYNRDIGQLLKGMAKVYSINASLSAAQRFQEAKLENAPESEVESIKQQTADITAAQSKLAFSQDAHNLVQKVNQTIRAQFEFETKGINKLLNSKGIDATFNLKKPEGREEFIKSIEKHLLPIMERDFFFGPDSTVFTASNSIYGLSMSTTDGKRKNPSNEYLKPEQSYAYEEFRNRLKALKNLPDSNFGKKINGIKDYSVSSYSTMFKNEATIKKNIANGKIKEWNKKVSLIHETMWRRFSEAIKNDNTENKEITRTIATYLKLVANDTSHWHKLGAQFEGYSKNPKMRFEYEHAMPATAAYIYLMDAALGGGDFNTAYNKVIDNYKLLALDKADDIKLTQSGLQRGMPKNWSIIDNIWWQRYFNDDVAKVDGGIDPNSIVLTNGKTLGEDLNIKSDGSPAIIKASKGEIQSKLDLLKARQSIDVNPRGMSTFDFDETLIIDGKNFVVATKDNEVVKITSDQWPIKGPDLAAQGYEFDFSDFANVRGGKEGPLLQKMKNQIKKYGNKNVFVLTARQQASAEPIQQWLKTQGIDIPLRNITGLGKSEGEAKGQWMLQKFAEGYNDMYFVDDALPNVKAVKDVLDQLDIKSKVVQAKIKFSEDGAVNFNKILERNSGVPIDKVFSDAQARLRGKKVDGFILKKFFVPPSAEDFKGLLYNFLGKGKQGDTDMAFFKEHLLDPFAKGIRDINFAKQRTSEEFKTLRKEMPTVIKGLNKKVSGTDFTVNDAIRVYLWNKNEIDVPGISEQEVSLLSDYVKGDPKTKAFADTLGVLSRAKEGYVKPGENWVVGNIASDLFGQSNQTNRAEYLSEWKNNVDVMFSPENMNKIEAVYGTDFREALENMLYRMETGSNRAHGGDKVVNGFMDWINGSVGAVMFFNTRSAMLQTLSTVNFINWGDNNIFQAAKAFANQPQYWKDFMTLFNSDMLKQRRSGMSIDVNLSELSNTVAKSGAKDKYKAAVGYLLQIGFTPTQIADSFAIASGGATYYRNKTNKYLKEGLSQKEAEAKAFEDFQEIAEETQQSSRPDLISQQQAGTLGRLVLAWQNTPMQYTRLTKKAISDLVNGRGDWKSHVSRILYYGAMQNIIFGSLQTGLAFLLFGGDEDEEKTKTKTTRVANGALDTLLRGTGVYGAMASTLKNTIMKYMDEKDKPYGRRELSKVALEAIQLSPPIGSKLRKIMSAIYSYEYNKGVPEKMGVSVDNPILNVVGNLIEATTNIPLARVVRKSQNVEEAINGNHETWKRVALILGWDKWSLDVKDADLEEAKAEVKQEKKEKKAEEKKVKKEEKKKLEEEAKAKEKEEKEKQGIKEVRCSGTKSNGNRCSIMIETKAKSAKCMYHKTYKPNEGSDNDGDGVKEYQCKGTTGSGKRCKNRTENTNKKCYAHQ